ncbi:MAG: cupin domain-containing protein [Pseudomonadota bacterium]
MAQKHGLHVFPAGSRAVRPGPEAYFVGQVSMEPVLSPIDPSRLSALRVTFLAGARTNWHTHPLGQTLYVLDGFGQVVVRGEAPVALRPGDTVHIPAGVDHWHGATSTTAMTHLALQEAQDGETATWGAPVSDAAFAAFPGPARD